MPNFLDLPPELRNQIYAHLLHPHSNRRHLGESFYEYNYKSSLVLYQLNRQIYRESRKIFYELNTFIRIATPWEQAKHHVALDGMVNIILSDESADTFGLHTLGVKIDAFYPPDQSFDDLHYFVILLESGDLTRFCRSWFYSGVSMPYLNAHLSLTITFHDPYTSASPFPIAGEPHIPKAKQVKLLEPFGQVKGLRDFRVSGELKAYPSVVKSVEEEMKKPLDPPEKCLENATQLKDLGNAALTAGRFKEAIDYYNKAFLAIHIIITGRHRRVYGDQWFDKVITAPGMFQNQHGGTARIVLRIRLVANTVLAYLKMKDYDMAIHTGMRTIKIMRASIGLDEDDGASDPNMEAMTTSVASSEMGKIYFRTGVAYKEIDDKTEARKLLKVAAIYLPHDKTVRTELASVALRLG